MSTNLEIDVLRSFVTGVQLKNFAQAARVVGRSQSAVSLQLRKLEQQTGQVLFQKVGRTLQLTEAGQTLLRYAQKLIDLNDETIAALSGDQITDPVRIGMPPDLAETWLPDLLGRFARAHPTIAMEARVDRNAILLADLANGSLDVVLFWSVDGDPGPSGRALARFPIVWIAPPGLSLATPQPVPLVLMGQPCLFAARGMESLKEAGRLWRAVFTSTSLSGIWAAVSADLGVTVRTTLGVPPGLQILPGGVLPDLGAVTLCVRTGPFPSRTSRRFLEVLDTTFGLAPGAPGAMPPSVVVEP